MADQDRTTTDAAPAAAPLGGSRAEAIQRLQVGIVGLFAMVLVMGVASAISNRAAVSEEGSVPDAAPTTEPTDPPAPSDPLADAGVVPVVPVDGEQGKEQDESDDEVQTVPDIAPESGADETTAN